VTDSLEYFWQVAETFLDDPETERGTMMGFPCLRQGGQFFASVHPETGDLIVKVRADRVQELMDQGIGKAFAPNGRTFREWVIIPKPEASSASALWSELLTEARQFVAPQLRG